jgi:hypothetical protein
LQPHAVSRQLRFQKCKLLSFKEFLDKTLSKPGKFYR